MKQKAELEPNFGQSTSGLQSVRLGKSLSEIIIILHKLLYLRDMKKIAKKLFFVNNSNRPYTLKEVRRRLLSLLLFVINILVFPVLVLATIEAIHLHQFQTAISFAALYFPILAAFLFQKKLPYKISVLLLLFSGIAIGVVNIIVYGFSGAGLPIFCFMGVLAALFLGSRAGYITVLICSIPMIIVAILMTNDLLSVGVDLMEISTLPISWATAIIVMLFLGSMMIFGFGILQQNLTDTIKYSETQAFDLSEANMEYEAINEELRESNEELSISRAKAEESDRLKSAFLANMSHEIRTPMNGILGFSKLLEKPDLTGEKQHEYIGIIQKSGARMLNIINDIVSISKIESGLVELNMQELNINEQIEHIYSLFKPESEKKGMVFLFRNALPSSEAIIKTDQQKVFSILSNLVKNAFKYSEEGKIEIGYIQKGNYLEFYVKDTGIGIADDRKEAVFERFIQADIADVDALQGAGLGLSISKAYVEMLGGKIWLESELGKGSSFYFSLPYQPKISIKQSENSESPPPEDVPPMKKLKILIAEDDEASKEFLSVIIEPFAREIICVETGTEAIEACRNNPDFDLVLMDILMPELDGYEASKQIRQFNKDIIIIAQTAFAFDRDIEKALQAGCNNHISKPISAERLEQMLMKYSNKNSSK
jgi:signal transduction histidine kinase/CheY-like chemotaxis protein